MPDFRFTVLFSLLCLAVFVAGCEPRTAEEKAEKDPLVKALYKVGAMYHGYHDAHGAGPANWEELASVAGSMSGDEQEYLDAIQVVKNKGYNVKWGVKLSSLTESATNTVMAESPQGGPKLMFDGLVSIQ